MASHILTYVANEQILIIFECPLFLFRVWCTELRIPWLAIIVKHATLYSPVISHLHSNYPEHTGGIENKGSSLP